MNLYLVHCGFYDKDLCDGVYESHVNFFVVAESFEKARTEVKLIPEYKAKKMHVDGLQEIKVVNGYEIKLEHLKNLAGETHIHNHLHHDLAPKT